MLYNNEEIEVYETPSLKWTTLATTINPGATVTTLMFHPLAHFPVVKAHDPPIGDPFIKFLANCNNSPQWLFGRNTPFPVVDPSEHLGRIDPRYDMVLSGQVNPYQSNPLFDDWCFPGVAWDSKVDFLFWSDSERVADRERAQRSGS